MHRTESVSMKQCGVMPQFNWWCSHLSSTGLLIATSGLLFSCRYDHQPFGVVSFGLVTYNWKFVQSLKHSASAVPVISLETVRGPQSNSGQPSKCCVFNPLNEGTSMEQYDARYSGP